MAPTMPTVWCALDTEQAALKTGSRGGSPDPMETRALPALVLIMLAGRVAQPCRQADAFPHESHPGLDPLTKLYRGGVSQPHPQALPERHHSFSLTPVRICTVAVSAGDTLPVG